MYNDEINNREKEEYLKNRNRSVIEVSIPVKKENEFARKIDDLFISSMACMRMIYRDKLAAISDTMKFKKLQIVLPMENYTLLYNKNYSGYREYTNNGILKVNNNYAYHMAKDGFYYSGDFTTCRHGKGNAMWSNLDVYNGDWKDGVRTGIGIYKFHDSQAVYFGEHLNNQFVGFGCYINNSGYLCMGEDMYTNKKLLFLRYNGEDVYALKNYKGSDTGTMIEFFSTGCYAGEFKGESLDGEGIFIWDTGGVYKGSFKNGKQHGQGIDYYHDGDMYVGEFSNGKKHGQGCLYDSYGKVIKKGIWKEGVYCG